MLEGRSVIVDSFCEVKEFTKQFEDQQFYSFDNHDIVPGGIYIISRQTFINNIELIRQLAGRGEMLPVLANPAEGSETMLGQIVGLGITDLVRQHRILIIAGGAMQPDIPCLAHEHFLPKILDFDENLRAMDYYDQTWSAHRPYQFLFLNGRSRPHRRWLLNRLHNILDQAIWSNLDATHGHPIQLLDPEYEFEFYQSRTQHQYQGFAKPQLFNNDWGEIYLNVRAYSHSHFSLVTETVFDYPHSFRTEKIWKPIAIGHPFVVAANVGYYRDLQQLGFKTFDGIIDESFDSIKDNDQRIERLAQVVEDLAKSDLSSFAQACRSICKYNQQRLAELRTEVRHQFPQRFVNFIKACTASE